MSAIVILQIKDIVVGLLVNNVRRGVYEFDCLKIVSQGLNNTNIAAFSLGFIENRNAYMLGVEKVVNYGMAGYIWVKLSKIK